MVRNNAVTLQHKADFHGRIAVVKTVGLDLQVKVPGNPTRKDAVEGG